MAPSRPNGGNGSTKEKGGNRVWPTLAAAGAAVGVAAVALWGLAKILADSDDDEDEKMMKAPGKDYFIPRKEFEENPADWFRTHRK